VRPVGGAGEDESAPDEHELVGDEAAEREPEQMYHHRRRPQGRGGAGGARELIC
jgi:hypothetical protein